MKTKMIVKDTDIDKIITEGQMIRYTLNDERVVELSMSITSKGLLEPIIIQPLEDGRFQLLAGLRRLTACKRLKWKTIPAVHRKDDGSPIKTIALIENVMQEPMLLAEEIEAVNHLYDVEKQSPAMICDTTGKGRRWVDQRLAAPHLHEEVLSELLDGRISLRHAEIINAIEAQNLRSLLLNNVMQQRLSARQTKELAKIYQESPSMESAIEEGIRTANETASQKTPTRVCDNCGTTQPINKIALVAVCAEGCIQQQLTEKEDINGNGDKGKVRS